jgi:hypothetical protein
MKVSRGLALVASSNFVMASSNRPHRLRAAPRVNSAQASRGLARAACSARAITSIRDRSIEQKPYWDLERARVGETRKVPVEVIVNGQPVARTEITADGSVEDVSFDVPIKISSWVALRVYPSSHTNPVFITVGGKPLRASKKSADWCIKSVDQCWSKKEPAIRKSEKEAAKKAFDVAREAYKKIRSECESD